MIVNVKLEGTSPLLQNRFAAEGMPAPKATVKNMSKITDDVDSKLYKDSDGNIYQPSTHIIGTMKKAGARFQIPGQGKLTYKNMIGSGVIIVTPDAIVHNNQEWETDSRSVIIGRARIIRQRPVFKDWSIDFQLDIDEEEINGEVVKDILDHAGKRVGIGDFRPEKGGSFGRFHVTKWKTVK
jgi:hypothetical protein